MRTILSRWRVCWAACFVSLLIGGPALAREDAPRPLSTPLNDDRALFNLLGEAIDRGAEIYNNGNAQGCYRYFHGALMVYRPLLTRYPELQKTIDAGLAEAEKLDSGSRRAFALREVFAKLQAGVDPDRKKPIVKKPPDDKKPVVDKKPDDKKPVVDKKPDDKKPVVDDKKPVVDKKPNDQKPIAKKTDEVNPVKVKEYWNKVASICDSARTCKSLDEAAKEYRRMAGEMDRLPKLGVDKDSIAGVSGLAAVAAKMEQLAAKGAAYQEQNKAPSPLTGFIVEALQGEAQRTLREMMPEETEIQKSLRDFLTALSDWERRAERTQDRLLNRAENIFQAELWLVPKDARGYVARGVVYHLAGDDKRAISDFDRALSINPRFTLAYTARARVYAYKGLDYTKAIADCSQAIRLDARYAAPYFVRAFCYFQKGQLDLAIADCNEATKLDRKYASAYAMRGGIYFTKKGETDQALADSNEAIKLDAKMPFAFVVRGSAYAQKGQYDKAVADISEALRLDPENRRAYHALARLRATCPDAKQRDGKKAVEYAKKACDLSTGINPILFDTLAAAYAECGQFQEAVKWASKALDLAERPDSRKEIQAHLELFQAGKPYRSKLEVTREGASEP